MTPHAVLVDGNNHQIDAIRAEARARRVMVSIIVDFVHVLEYVWSAAWSFYDEGDPAAETWVHDKASAILNGEATRVAAAIRRKITYRQLDSSRSLNAAAAPTTSATSGHTWAAPSPWPWTGRSPPA